MTMSIDTTELIYLVLGPGVLLLLVILLRVDMRLRERYEELQSRLTEVEGRLAVLHSISRDDSRERELEVRMELLSRQQEQLMLRDAETGPYYRAVRIAERGGSVEALIEQTGVTRNEAELICKLHGLKADENAGGDSQAT